MADRRLVGLIFILLIVGAEANRVEQDLRLHSHRGLRIATKRRAAAIHREQKSNISPDEELSFALQGLALNAGAADDLASGGAAVRSGEAARGMLQYQGRQVYAVMRAWDEAGSAQIDLYRVSDLDFVTFRVGAPLPADVEPAERLIVRHDDAVFMAHQERATEAFSVACERRYGKKLSRASRDVIKLAPLESSLSIRIKGADDWLKVGGPRDVASAWLTAVRILQTVGTCVEDGSCLMQCTYVAKQNACNSEHFCSLVKERDPLGTRSSYLPWKASQRERCIPKRGAKATKAAWVALVQSASKDAKKVKEEKCVLSCKTEWKRSAQNVQLALSLKGQLEGIVASEQSLRLLPAGMTAVVKAVVEEAELLSEEVTNSLGTAFDEKRRKKTSALRKALRDKGCANLEDGSMQALITAASRPNDAAASSRFAAYAESCPWFQELQVTDTQRLEQLSEQMEEVDRAIGNTEARVLREGEDNFPSEESNATLTLSASSMQASKATPTSLMELQAEPLLIVLGLLALVAVFLLVAGFWHIYAGKQCRDQESLAHRHCSKKYLNMKSPCDKEIRWGIYYLIAGAAILTIVVSIFTLGAGTAAGGGAVAGGGTAAAGTSGGTAVATGAGGGTAVTGTGAAAVAEGTTGMTAAAGAAGGGGVVAAGTGGGTAVAGTGAAAAAEGTGGTTLRTLGSGCKSLWLTLVEQLHEKEVQIKLLELLGDGLIGLIAYVWGKKSGASEAKNAGAWELEELHLQETMYQRCMAVLEPDRFGSSRVDSEAGPSMGSSSRASSATLRTRHASVPPAIGASSSEVSLPAVSVSSSRVSSATLRTRHASAPPAIGAS